MDVLLEQISMADQALDELYHNQEVLAETVFGWDTEREDVDSGSDMEWDDEEDGAESTVTLPYYSVFNLGDLDSDDDSDSETIVEDWVDVYTTPSKE